MDTTGIRTVLLDWHDYFTAGAGVLAAAVIAIFITNRFSTVAKRADFFLDFTKRYHAIRAQMHTLNSNVNRKRNNNPTHALDQFERDDAHQMYFQIFGLVYDEFYAHEQSFLPTETFVDWMTWQMCDAKENRAIGGVSYEDGWKVWCSIPAIKIQRATRFMNEIRKCLESPELDAGLDERSVQQLRCCVERKVIDFSFYGLGRLVRKYAARRRCRASQGTRVIAAAQRPATAPSAGVTPPASTAAKGS